MSDNGKNESDVQKHFILDFWRRFRKNKAALLGLITILFLSIIAILTPIINPIDPFDMNLRNMMQPPNKEHLFGTDELGRDILTRTMYGTRNSLTVGFFAVAMSLSIGIFLGSVSGFFGGKIDEMIMRITDIFLTLPTFFLIIIIASIFGSDMYIIALLIGFTRWPTPARLVRAEVLTLKERPFIESARVIGAKNFTIILNEILPNALYPAIINASMTVASTIMLEANLAFLGLGDPNRVSWGWMLNGAIKYFFSSWWMSVYPGLAIVITVLSFNALGDGLNDAFNPYLKER